VRLNHGHRYIGQVFDGVLRSVAAHECRYGHKSNHDEQCEAGLLQLILVSHESHDEEAQRDNRADNGRVIQQKM
jgi:hypothetical protein